MCAFKIKKILFFDIETSGLHMLEDVVLQVSMLEYMNTGTTEPGSIKCEMNAYIDPRIDGMVEGKDFTISKEASDLHLITIDQLNKTSINGTKVIGFKEMWLKYFEPALKDCDAIGTYNGTTFDIPFILNNVKRFFGEYSVEYQEAQNLFVGKTSVDCYAIETQLNSRTLEAVYTRYYPDEPIEQIGSVHNSLTDIWATVKIYEAQKKQTQVRKSPNGLDDFVTDLICTNNSMVLERGGNYKGKLMMNFGKYKGKPVNEVIKMDRNYFKWYWENVVSPAGHVYFTNYVKTNPV